MLKAIAEEVMIDILPAGVYGWGFMIIILGFWVSTFEGEISSSTFRSPKTLVLLFLSVYGIVNKLL